MDEAAVPFIWKCATRHGRLGSGSTEMSVDGTLGA